MAVLYLPTDFSKGIFRINPENSHEEHVRKRVELVKHLKPTETTLPNWAFDLMSDVAEQEELNKMNARNIAMVFAPNMTQVNSFNL